MLENTMKNTGKNTVFLRILGKETKGKETVKMTGKYHLMHSFGAIPKDSMAFLGLICSRARCPPLDMSNLKNIRTQKKNHYWRFRQTINIRSKY